MPLQNKGMLKVILLSSTVLLSGTAVADNWQLDMDKDGIQLYTQTSPNNANKQIKVVTTLKARLSSLVSFLSDHNAFPDWMDKISKVEKLKEINEKESITYTVIDSPWPERDRDNVLYSRWEQDPKTLVVTKKIFSEPQYVKEDSSMIRTPAFEAQWVLTPQKNGEVEVAYESSFDPGGDAQGWLLEMFTYEMPYNTIKNLKESQLAGHQNARVAFIKEPGRVIQ